jgi:hypothetical protein
MDVPCVTQSFPPVAAAPKNDPATKMRVAFMHVPKTAGSATRQGFIEAIRPQSVLLGSDLSLFGGFTDFGSVDPALRKTVYFSPGELPSDAELVTGHIACSTLRVACPSHRLMTILREPRCRVISHWLFWRSIPDADLVPWGSWDERVKTARGSLLQFLTSPMAACQTDNVLVRMLLWPHAGIADQGFIPPEADADLLEAARRTLQGFDFAGVVEDPILESRLGDFLGAPFDLPRVNETSAQSEVARPILAEEFDELTLAALSARSRLDAVLWREVVARQCLLATPELVAERAMLHCLFHYVDAGVTRLSGSAAEVAREQAVSRLPAIEAERERAAERIAAMRGSLSWRVTAPLRALSRGVRSVFHV